MIVLSLFNPFSKVAIALTTTGAIFLFLITVEDIGSKVTLALT
ncbi:MAG TPA: hypothetical protein V6C71_19685 [Coleofasciculaceae cyanobacterium]